MGFDACVESHLRNRVLPEVLLRQWVLSLPKGLRYLLAYNNRLCCAVAGAVMQVVMRFLRMQGG